MEEQNVTPEEKLLNFIEHPQALKAKLPIMPRARGFDAQTIKLQIMRWWEKRASLGFNLPLVNKILLGACIVCSLAAVAGFLGNQAKVKTRLVRLENGGNSDPANLEAKKFSLLAINLDEALVKADKRNIFSFTLPKAQTPMENTATLLVDQKLVGIIWSSNPQVIIEDTKEGKTSLLGVGDAVGRLKIKKIYRDKVVVEAEGQEMELR